MSREIKFRAWDTQLKEMTKAFGLFDVADSCCDGPKDMEIMQYTGLTDKNGVEIYEGDIVRAPVNPPIGEVTFENGRWLIRHKPLIDEIVCTDLNYASVKIVGNIYEHKKLLK